MGNHEYCVDCGESDFHLHRGCDPVKVARKQESERVRLEQKARCIDKMVERLNAAGIPFRLDNVGRAIINPWDFLS